jgi:putative colanic acid biosynthesis glycosyltransferase
MPKVFQICVEGNSGSTGRIAEEIGILAIQRGWESYIAYGRFKRPSKSNLIHIGSPWTVFLHGIKTRLFDKHSFGSKGATKKLIKRITDINPDIIHLHHLHGYYINIAVLFNYLSKSNIPVVWTFHDCWSFTGHCAHFDFIGCDRWKTKCYDCPQKGEYPASLFIDRSTKNFYEKRALFTSVIKMVIVPVSYWLDSIVNESFLKEIPRRVIHNGINTSVFKPQQNTSVLKETFGINGKFVLLGVANPWTDKKGLSGFIHLSKFLKNDEIIILVGLTKSQIRKLPSNIIGIERTENREELVNLYSAADIFLNLSVEETFGLTTAEALSCGTPVIAYNSTASPEVIDEKTGIIVNKNDYNGLINAVEEIRNFGKKHYSDACRERVVNLFKIENKHADYFNLYMELI